MTLNRELHVSPGLQHELLRLYGGVGLFSSNSERGHRVARRICCRRGANVLEYLRLIRLWREQQEFVGTSTKSRRSSRLLLLVSLLRPAILGVLLDQRAAGGEKRENPQIYIRICQVRHRWASWNLFIPDEARHSNWNPGRWRESRAMPGAISCLP